MLVKEKVNDFVQNLSQQMDERLSSIVHELATIKCSVEVFGDQVIN